MRKLTIAALLASAVAMPAVAQTAGQVEAFRLATKGIPNVLEGAELAVRCGLLESTSEHVIHARVIAMGQQVAVNLVRGSDPGLAKDEQDALMEDLRNRIIKALLPVLPTLMPQPDPSLCAKLHASGGIQTLREMAR